MSALVAAVVTVVVVGATTAGHRAPRCEASVAAPAASSPAARARAVLRAWDHRRAAAWALADRVALVRLYLPGSATGRRDVAMLDAYRDRGLRVAGMTRQVVRLRVAAATPSHLHLVVTDRLVDTHIVGAGVRSAVPDSDLATREVWLARAGGRWRVAEVTADAGHPAR